MERCSKEIRAQLEKQKKNSNALQALGDGMWSYTFQLTENTIFPDPSELEPFGQQDESWIEIGCGRDRDVGSAKVYVNAQTGQLARWACYMGFAADSFDIFEGTLAQVIEKNQRNKELANNYTKSALKRSPVTSLRNSISQVDSIREMLVLCSGGSSDNPLCAIRRRFTASP